MNTVEEWLSEKRSSQTAILLRRRFNIFIEWYNPKAIEEIETKKPKKRAVKKKIEVEPFYSETIKQLSQLTSKEAKSLLLKFQRQKLDEGTKANSVRAYISAAKNFLEEAFEFSIKLRGKVVEAEEAEGYHNFSNGDLLKMFEVASLQYKALIATSSSLGWGIDDILHLNKKHIESLITHAKEHSQNFVFYETKRRKTKAKTLAILNPLALEWLDRWIQHNTSENLWTASYDAISQMLVKLVERSGITLTGKVRFHKIRAWVINSLIKAGFSSEQWKYVVGKKIPSSDSTYLNLKQQIIDKYPEVYEEHLCIIKTPLKIVMQKDPETSELKRIIETQKQALQLEVKERMKLHEDLKNHKQAVTDLLKLTSFLKTEIETLKKSKP